MLAKYRTAWLFNNQKCQFHRNIRLSPLNSEFDCGLICADLRFIQNLFTCNLDSIKTFEHGVKSVNTLLMISVIANYII